MLVLNCQISSHDIHVQKKNICIEPLTIFLQVKCGTFEKVKHKVWGNYQNMQFKMPRVIRQNELLKILWENQTEQKDLDFSPPTTKGGPTIASLDNSNLISRVELSSIKDLYNVQIFVVGNNLQKAVSGHFPVGCSVHA